MSEEAITKRKIDETEGAPEAYPESKKSKQEIDDDEVNVDLNFLKSSIVKEVTTIFQDKFTNLEKQISELKQLLVRPGNSVQTEGNEVNATEKKKVEEEAPKVESKAEAVTQKETVPKVEAVPQVKLQRSETSTIEKPKATFGSNLFVIKTNATTPTNSFSSERFETPTAPNTAENTPKPVFGATSSFGKSLADSWKNKKNVFDGLPSQELSPFGAKPATSSFGSNSKFGNAFQDSLGKKSFLDESSTENVENKPPASQQFKQVDLEQVQNVQTGEEDEKSRFTATAKIFELDLSKISEGWKERGLGPIHLNQSLSNKHQARLVMRSQGLLRVVLNYKISPKTQLLKGLEASLTPEKFVRLNSAGAEGQPIQYLIKFGSELLRDKLVAEVELIKKEIEDLDSKIDEKPTKSSAVQWL